MRHIVFLVKKRPDLSQEEFARYWIDEHTPFTARVKGIVSYRCYPALPGQENAPFDGVAILSFVDDAAYKAAMASEEFATALADAPNFQDTEATDSFEAEEAVVI
jgi:uncharacterized protein (TIGR02118 family)